MRGYSADDAESVDLAESSRCTGISLTAGLPISQEQHPDPVELNAYLAAFRAAVKAVPGVRETAMTSVLPLEGWGYGVPYSIAPFRPRRVLVCQARPWGARNISRSRRLSAPAIQTVPPPNRSHSARWRAHAEFA